jgi:CRISPR-associated protein Csh1
VWWEIYKKYLKMIKEITQFVDELEKNNPDVFFKNLKLKEGLYIFLDIEKQDEAYILKNKDNDGNILKDDIGLFTEEIEMNPFFEKCLKLQTNSIPVSPAKIFNPNKKIYNASCSPFALCFNKKNFIKYDSEILKDELKNQYFKTAEKYINNEKQEQIEWFEIFKGFMVNDFLSFINELEEFTEAKNNFNVSIFLKQPQIKDYIETHQLYLRKNVFNKDKFNKKIDDEVLGISDSLSGFNDKKRFLQHKTAPLEYNYRINGNKALKIWKFFRMQKNNQLPNPMPIFIDKQELNGKLVSIYNDNRKKGFAEIMKGLWQNHEKDLQDFYLIFFHNGLKGSRIIDLDFVPVFEYEIDNIKLEEVFPIGGKLSSLSIKNVFDFERIVLNKIFDGILISNFENGRKIRYFSDFNDRKDTDIKYINNIIEKRRLHIILNLVLKYRKSFYDFIYKSKRHAITNVMFQDIMQNTIFNDIRHDEYKSDKKYHTNEISIKEKLNIWLCLYEYFKPRSIKNKLIKNNLMATKIKQHHEMMSNLIEGKVQPEEFSSEDFAFVSGQVIYYILSKSKSADKSYSKLEPFLQKSNYESFLEAISNLFATFKHENFTLKFKKPFSYIMDFKVNDSNNKPLKKLLPNILAGFFSDNQLFSDNTKSDKE